MNMVEAARLTLEKAREAGLDNTMMDDEDVGYDHLADMYRQMSEPGCTFSEAKMGRWLGWIQGCVVSNSCGEITLEDMKQINKSVS